MPNKTDERSIETKGPTDERALEVSYGQPVPQPKLKKGDAVCFGILAGSTDTAPAVEGVRTTTFGDSVEDAAKNL